MMEAESQEIENLKFKINDLSTKLINPLIDLNGQLDISKEIKEKIESLLFLLNKKKIIINFQNDMQQQFQQMQVMQQQIMQYRMSSMGQSMQINNPNTIKSSENQMINIIFRVGLNSVTNEKLIILQCYPNDKCSDIIEKFRNKINDYERKSRFIYNAKNLNPNLTVSESGITEGANIFVKF